MEGAWSNHLTTCFYRPAIDYFSPINSSPTNAIWPVSKLLLALSISVNALTNTYKIVWYGVFTRTLMLKCTYQLSWRKLWSFAQKSVVFQSVPPALACKVNPDSAQHPDTNKSKLLNIQRIPLHSLLCRLRKCPARDVTHQTSRVLLANKEQRLCPKMPPPRAAAAPVCS